MHRKLVGVILFLTVLSTGLVGQLPMQFSQYMSNKYQMNPAYAGFDFSLNVTALYRSQWNDFLGSPVTQNINAHLPMYFLNGAIGINVANEQLGQFNNTLGTISYNYVLETTVGLFSGGIKAGMIQFTLNGSNLRTPDGVYEGATFTHNDGTLSEIRASGVGVLYGVGVYFIGDFIEGGASISSFPNSSIGIDATKVELLPFLNVYLESGIPITEDIIISPSILVKSDFVQTQLDVAALVKLSGSIFGGLGIRGYNSNSIDAAIIYAGWQFNEHYTISYAYDVGLSSLRNSHSGSHEILLNYNLNRLIGAGLPPKIIYNPRYL